MNKASICKGTPTISVVDNRNLQIRTLKYNRVTDEEQINEYITRNTYTLLGYLESSIDPRLFSKYQGDNNTSPNIRRFTSLREEELRTESVDAGSEIGLFNIEGKSIWFRDANNTETSMEHDLIGRPIAVFEKQENQERFRCRERYIYGENERDAQANNLCGQLVRHYDTAGRSQSKSFSLSGIPLYHSRQLLKNIDEPSNWSANSESTWVDSLDVDTYDTSWKYDIQGKKITQIDAKGNLQTVTYNVVGQPKAVNFTLQGQTEQSIVSRIEYNAAGQVQRAEAGNGILTEYTYEESTHRLIRKKDSRELSSGKRDVLQDYYYEYDPVGNILSITNEADSIRFFRNQMIEPKRQYTYDALYQLVSSSGREADSFRQQQSYPSLITPISLDDSQYVNYFEKYSYDRGGNLIQLSHKGASQYNTDLSIDDTSNRGIWKQKDEIPNIADSFDRAGNQKVLRSGIPLKWDSRNQLSRVDMVLRENEDNDLEIYTYDSTGIRIVKRNIRKTKTNTQTNTTVYLPGLELRTRQTGDNITENLQVITLDVGGTQVRVLHWENETQPNGISNDQYRYSINDHLRSSMLELDMQGQIISKEEFYPYGGTALWTARTEVEANYKSIRYSGKERDATGLYYYGYRYYMPWLGRWLNPDPAGTAYGLNLYCMVENNPITLVDEMGLKPISSSSKTNNNALTEQEVLKIEDLAPSQIEDIKSSTNVELYTLHKGKNTNTTWDQVKGNFKNSHEKKIIAYTFAKEKQLREMQKNEEQLRTGKTKGIQKKMKLSNEQIGPALAVVYNTKTKEYYTSINRPNGKIPDTLHPKLKNYIYKMPKVVEESYQYTNGAASHAEVYAVNKALWASKETKFSDLTVYVQNIQSVEKGFAIRPFITCPHCKSILGKTGANIISNNHGLWNLGLTSKGQGKHAA
ncbi:toxin [Bacillus cereus]|uniref:RHS repeat-associated core domain-containing protein n=1 Tax=Bacillus cereus TaxID=1396 RepID=UPI000BEBA233|nr:RHS repeat-associated core domain-containing protein [Bacillus cereus]PED88614.1 toxin [Bacillus cereus]PES12922.1 toxin [Bacillus cereus]PEW54122.1 toxin [Bacillus cereus]PFC73261.1 toxin [Bacillus cereus]PFL22582.1 toxin [Bacillus cereus]